MRYSIEECVVSRDLESIEIDRRWTKKTPKDPLARKSWFKTTHHGRIPSDITDALVSEYSQPGDWTSDILLGSGTFGCSALMLGRNFVGNELDPSFIEDCRRNLHAARRDGGHEVKVKLFNGDARFIDMARWYGRCQLVYVSPPSYHPYGSKWRSKAAENKENLNYTRGWKYFEDLAAVFDNACRLVTPGGHMVISGRDFCQAKGEKMPEEWIAEDVPRLVRYSSMLLNFMLRNSFEPTVRYLVKSRSPWNKINHQKYGTPLIPYDTFVVAQKPVSLNVVTQ